MGIILAIASDGSLRPVTRLGRKGGACLNQEVGGGQHNLQVFEVGKDDHLLREGSDWSVFEASVCAAPEEAEGGEA